MRWKDTATGYGWVSIILHWVTAVFIIVMLFVGNSIVGARGIYDDKLRLHTTLAFIFYLALWFRIYWRFAKGHPGPLPRQKGFFFYIGKYTHLSLLVALTGMLISGPIMAWSGGLPVNVGHMFEIASPIPMNADLFTFMHQIHVACATFLAVGALLHIGGAAKHFFINNDGTVDKILVAANPVTGEPEPPRTVMTEEPPVA